jgi:hypothetical protein
MGLPALIAGRLFASVRRLVPRHRLLLAVGTERRMELVLSTMECKIKRVEKAAQPQGLLLRLDRGELYSMCTVDSDGVTTRNILPISHFAVTTSVIVTAIITAATVFLCCCCGGIHGVQLLLQLLSIRRRRQNNFEPLLTSPLLLLLRDPGLQLQIIECQVIDLSQFTQVCGRGRYHQQPTRQQRSSKQAEPDGRRRPAGTQQGLTCSEAHVQLQEFTRRRIKDHRMDTGRGERELIVLVCQNTAPLHRGVLEQPAPRRPGGAG